LQNIVTLWSALDMRRRVIVVGSTLIMFLAVLGMSRMASTPSMALLYAGLDASAAGQVIASLEQRGVQYEIRGDSIHVDASQRDSLRMTLATEGLPVTGGAGYELLDQLSGFGTTSQMFDAAYWRAKEGELARTILASPQIRAARVHIAQAPSQPFQRDRIVTASVTVTTRNGSLQPAQAQALRHLVAAAVAGMQPEDVQVIDSVAGLVASPADPSSQALSGDGRSAEIRRNVERMLEARVGVGKAVVEVSVEVETEREAITERRFDPQGRVAISSETEESSGSTTSPGGDVTVASNLPEGDAAAGSGQSQTTETKERVNYEVSETQREVLRMPGTLRRLSVAVLVDGTQVVSDDGTAAWQPRPEEELAILRELVASAVGLDETRGDVLTLRTLEFQPQRENGTLAEAGVLSGLGQINPMSALQLGVLAFVALVLGLFVLRPILTSPARQALSLSAGTAPLALPGLDGGRSGAGVLTGEIDDASTYPEMPVVNREDTSPDAKDSADPMVRLRRLIETRQAESVEILRGWMEAGEERN